MPTPESGRQRARRIPLDYFKQPSSLERGKFWLAVLAVALSLGWLGFSMAQGQRGNSAFSRGHVAAVHSAWDQTCAACHDDFHPITKQNFLLSLGVQATTDTRCESCHSGAPHHDNQKAESTSTCGGCHRDHRGLDASLVRLGDADCTSCHANLNNHVTGGQSGYTNVVTDFASPNGHPEFRVLDKKMADPGVIKFNHAQHMMPGQVIAPGQASPWTLKKLNQTEPSADKRYRGAPWQQKKNDDDLVVLDCRSCHQLDAGDFDVSTESLRRVPSAVVPNRAQGAYMLPIVYDTHCKACHPLRFDDKEPSYVVPHRYQPDAIRTFVERTYADEFLKKTPGVLDAVVTRPLPGKSLTPEQEKAKAYLDEKVTRGMRTLFLGKKTCGECHYAEGKTNDDHVTEVPKKLQVGPSEETKKAGWFQHTSSIPDVWYLHAKFDHVSHRAVDCRQCHDKAVTSTTNKDVLVPGVANCRSCHSPAGGVRHDCTECHKYHHGDRPLQGLGAKALGPKNTVDIQKFLRGARD